LIEDDKAAAYLTKGLTESGQIWGSVMPTRGWSSAWSSSGWRHSVRN